MLTVLKEELLIEKARYTKNITGKLFALGIYALLILRVPPLIAHIVPQLLAKMSPAATFTLLFSGTMVTTGLLFNLFMLYVYRAKLPFFEQYRVDPKRPWPWEEQPKKWKDTLFRSLCLNISYLCLFVPLITYFDCRIKFSFVLDPALLPSTLQIVKQLAILYVLQDFLFFSAHYMLHQPYLYKHVHKVHHEYNTSVSIAGLHQNIFQLLLSNVIPHKIYFGVLGWLCGPVHVSTAVIWTALRIYDAYNGHCGYMFSWTPIQVLPFCANDDFHDFHHSHNVGNFSSQLRIWDILCGTSRNYKTYKNKQKQQ